MTDFSLPLIQDDPSYFDALGEMRRIMDANPEPGSPEAKRLDALMLLAKAYDRSISPEPVPVHPLEAIKYAVEFRGMAPRQLAELFGGRNRLSEVMARKRPLTLPMIRKLSNGLGLSLEILCSEYELADDPAPTNQDRKTKRRAA